MKREWIAKKCKNSDEGDKNLINIKQWKTRGNSGTRSDNHNGYFKINNEMILTFVFIYGNDAMVAGNMNNCVIICNNDVV